MSDMTPQAVRLSDSVDGMRQRAMIVGAVGIVAAIAGAVLNPAQFFQSYLVAFVFWTSVALGCLGLLMLQHLSGGQWGLVTRRVFEAGARNLPMMARALPRHRARSAVRLRMGAARGRRPRRRSSSTRRRI